MQKQLLKFIIINIYYILYIILLISTPYLFEIKYFGDSNLIFESQSSGLHLGSSFGSTAYIYSFLFSLTENLGIKYYLEQYKSFDFYFINIFYFNIFYLFFIIMMFKISGLKRKNYIIIMLLFIFTPIYFGQPNKDLIPFILFFIYFIYLNNKINNTSFLRSYLLFIVLFIIYAIYFRYYYFILFLLIPITYFILLEKKYIYLKLIFFLILYFLGVQILFSTGLNQLIYYGRQSQLIEVTNTWIDYMFTDTSEINFLLNRISVFFRLLFPIELIFVGIKYIPFIIWKIYLTYLIIKSIKIHLLYKNYKILLTVSIILSFNFVQSLFEPDFGSVLRHISSLLPLYFYLYISINKYKG